MEAASGVALTHAVNAQIKKFIEEELATSFGRLILFVKQTEVRVCV